MEQTTTRRDAQPGYGLAIGTLSITAVVLLVGMLVVTLIQDRASALGLSDRGGDYIILTMQFNRGTENIVLTDAAAKRLNVYAFDLSTKRLEIWASKHLDQLPRGADEAGPAGGRRNQQRNRGR